jgi:hypothetical protein
LWITEPITYKMDNRKHLRTCVSSNDHRYAIQDVCLHYFGCLRVTEREEYFNKLLPHEKERIKVEEQRIYEQHAFFGHNEETKLLVQSLRTSLDQLFQKSTERGKVMPAPAGPCKENAFGMNAYMAFPKNSEPFDDPSSLEKFPDQKIPILDLLYRRDKMTNPRMRCCKKDEFRYFHLPINNGMGRST